MENPKFKNRLNHFILWSKSWYINLKKEDMFDSARRALKMDGYVFCKTDTDVLSIVSNFIDDYRDWLFKHCPEEANKYIFRQHVLFGEINRNMVVYEMDYPHALLSVYKSYFAFDINLKHFDIEKPVYSKKLYSDGFVLLKKQGMTYREMNRYVSRIFP